MKWIKNKKILFGIILFTIFALIPVSGSSYAMYLNAQILFTILSAISLNLLIGYAGLFSFGHVAYYAIGAYTYAILTKTYGVPFWVGFFSGPIAAAVMAAIFGYFSVRLTKMYFTFITLAFAQIVWAIAFKWTPVTGGDSGMVGITPPDFLVSLSNTYYFILVVVAVLVFIIYKIAHSPFGLILNTTRDNPNRAEFIGVNVRRYQVIDFTIAGFFAGFAGVLFTILTHSVFPDIILVTRSIELVIMVVLGGMYQFWGPAIGTIILLLLNDTIKAQTEYWPLVLGIILVAVILLMPQGITGIISKAYAKFTRRFRAQPTEGGQ
jgi:branched-chain amino acid transport system permease protein